MNIYYLLVALIIIVIIYLLIPKQAVVSKQSTVYKMDNPTTSPTLAVLTSDPSGNLTTVQTNIFNNYDTPSNTLKVDAITLNNSDLTTTLASLQAQITANNNNLQSQINSSDTILNTLQKQISPYFVDNNPSYFRIGPIRLRGDGASPGSSTGQLYIEGPAGASAVYPSMCSYLNCNNIPWNP